MISQETQQVLQKRYYPRIQQVVFDDFGWELAKRLGEDAVVLDAGSGPGSWVLQEHRQQIELLVGGDIYRPDTLRLDAFVVGRCAQLPFDRGAFDMVVAYLVLEHLDDPLSAFREFARVLKPGGWFCFKTPAVRTPLFLLSRLLPTSLHQRLKSCIGTDEADVFPTYYRANEVTRLERGLSQAGFHRDWLRTVDQTYAYMTQTRLTYALGLLYSRLTQQRLLSWLRNQIVGIYRLGDHGWTGAG